LRCTTNGVNSIAQHGAAAALRGPLEPTLEMAREYQARRDLLLEGLRGVRALEPFRPRGSFFLWLRIHPSWPGYQGKADDWGMTNFLIDQGGVGCSPGTAFGPAGEGCIRLAFSCDRKQIESAIGEIRRLLA
jgi:aspartate aminotransferase